MMKKVSLLMITIDRYEITKQVLENNLKNCGHDFELLVADNGSSDKRIIDYVAGLNVKYHRLNKANEGCARTFNQLILRSSGDYICFIGNDILLPDGWLSELVKYSDLVKNSGIIGIKCTAALPPLANKDGISAHFVTKEIDKVFGTMLFSRDVLNKVGGFCDDYHPYGLEDSDFNNRVNIAGLQSLYVPNMESKHVGHDVGEKTEYRKMKDNSLNSNAAIHNKRCAEYATKGFYEPLPPMRDPLL